MLAPLALAHAYIQFKAQEPGTDDEVLQFCQLNYGVTFPIAKKVRFFFSISRFLTLSVLLVGVSLCDF